MTAALPLSFAKPQTLIARQLLETGVGFISSNYTHWIRNEEAGAIVILKEGECHYELFWEQTGCFNT